MENKNEIIEQSKLAFDFMQKLYFETSYLIKEIEGMLKEEEEKFVIGKPSGYGVTTRTSSGLEAGNVPLWLVRKLAVFYVPKVATADRKKTITKFGKKLKLIYARVILNEKDLDEPCLLTGVFHEIIKKTPANKFPKKVEEFMALLEKRDDKVFHKLDPLHYEDSYLQLKGKFFRVGLFDINNSEDIQKKIIEPVLKIFRKI